MISEIICNDYPKWIIYLMSKTCLLISFNIWSKVCYDVDFYYINSVNIGCDCNISWLFFLTSSPIVVVLSSPTQLDYKGSFVVTLLPIIVFQLLYCLCKWISIFFSFCQSYVLLALIGFLSLKTCCFEIWLWVITITITLIGTLSSLGGLSVVIFKL